MPNIVTIIKACGGIVVGSGCCTLVDHFFKDTIKELHGFQKISAYCGAACLGGYLGEKATEYLSNTIDEGMSVIERLKSGKPLIEEGEVVNE